MYRQGLCSLLIPSFKRIFLPLNLYCSKLIKSLSIFCHPWNILWVLGMNSPFFGGRFVHQRCGRNSWLSFDCSEMNWQMILNWWQPLCRSWGSALHLSSAQEEWSRETMQEGSLISWEPWRDAILPYIPISRVHSKAVQLMGQVLMGLGWSLRSRGARSHVFSFYALRLKHSEMLCVQR